MFDPIPQRDDYQPYAFFNNTVDDGHGKATPGDTLEFPGEAQAPETLRRELEEARGDLDRYLNTYGPAAVAFAEKRALYAAFLGYGASYVAGGRLMEETTAERARQLGDQFSMRYFFDEVEAVGLIPVSLIYWELTGDDRMVRELESTTGPLPPR